MKYTQPNSEVSRLLTITAISDPLKTQWTLIDRTFHRVSGRRSSTLKLIKRCGVTVTLCYLLLALLGCATSFTGDGIPPGRSAVIGIVVHADHPQTPVPNATVTVSTTVLGRGLSATRGTTTYTVYSDDFGKFQITGIPTDKISSNVTVTVDPNDKTLLAQKIVFPLANGRPTSLILALPAAGFPLNKIASIKLVQVTSTNTPVPLAQLKAQVLDANGTDLGIMPTLILDGALAGIATDGTINVTANPDVTHPIQGNPLGTVTATVDTNNNNGSQPSSSVSPVLPVGVGNNNPVPLGMRKL